MSISIDSEKCVGCLKCIDSCPGNIISLSEDGKAEVIHEDLCWGCTACLKECGVEAIKYFLGVDIGGKGGTMTVKKEKGRVVWTLDNGHRTERIITLERESNKY